MKKHLLLCLGVALLAACRKDDVVICGQASFANLRAAAPASQVFPFDVAQAQSFRTKAGATLAFPASEFILPDGARATGQAELRVREIYTVPDMLLANMPTTAQSSGRMLISGGEFNIQVWQGSTRLRLATVSASGVAQRLALTSPVPAAGLDTTRMMLWQQPASAQAGTSADSSGWQLLFMPGQTSTSTAPSPVLVPAAGGYYSAALPLDSIGSWNIDQFWHAYQTNGNGNITVETPAGTTTRVYFRPVGFNGLARAYASYPVGTRWHCLLPFGAPVIAVVLQERDGLLYFGTQQVTTAANVVVAPPLEAFSAEEIIRRIRLL